MAPRYWTVKIGERDFTVAAGTREAAEKIAAQRARQHERPSGPSRSRYQGGSGSRFRARTR
jgi:hypothetical protein